MLGILAFRQVQIALAPACGEQQNGQRTQRQETYGRVSGRHDAGFYQAFGSGATAAGRNKAAAINPFSVPNRSAAAVNTGIR